MRLHKLRLRAFGPYASEQVVDFDRLAHSGLFLLEGPTGAGKSTILDAVTFALYGGLAGADSADDRLRSHFAAPDTRTEVALEFSLRGVRHQVTRGPEYRRPKKRGEGFTTEASRVHLQRWDAERWTSVSSNKAEAGDAIKEAVGLTREQFTQVMLLPQGEFAKFLHSTDDVRRALLTKLFGTGLYDRITSELATRRTEATRARDRAGRAIAEAVSAAAEAAGLGAQERADLLAAAHAGQQTRLKELGESLAQTVASTGAALQAATAEVARAAAEDEDAKRQAALMGRLTGALAELRAHEETRASHGEREARLAEARGAEPVRPLLEALADAEAAVGSAADDLAGLLPGSAEDPLANRLREALAGQAGAAAESGTGAGRAGDALGGSGDDCASLAIGELVDRAKAAAGSRADGAEAQANALQRDVAAEEGLAAQRTELDQLERDLAGAEERVEELNRAKQDLPAMITSLQARLAAASSTAAGLDAASRELDAVYRRRDAAAQLAELQPRVSELDEARRTAVEVHQRLVDEHQRLFDARLAGSAAELAAGLVEGGPCPVCGSPTHPGPALASASTVSAEEVEQARRQRASADEARSRAEREHTALAIEAAGCEAVAEGRSAAELTAEADALAAQVGEAEAAGRDAARLGAELDEARLEQEQVVKDLQAAAEVAATARAKAALAREDLDRLAAELSSAAQGHSSVAARQAALRESAARDRAMAKALAALGGCLTAQATAWSRVHAEARARGFASPEEAAAAVLAAPEQAGLEAEVAAWDKTLAKLTAAAEAPDLAGLDPEGADQAEARAQDAAATLATAQQAEQDLRRAHDEAERKATRLSQRSAEVSAAEAACSALVERTEAVITLAGLANGTEGHRRVALTTYVLRYWFGQVVAAANVRLSAMSLGRYELRRTDEGKNKRDRSGLTLAVVDRHTGEERSPASLSGGETFYTSLALALGLADVVRAQAGGVDLDTLFIDEGFGSLDADTLDQVMGVIDELRDRGRVIGIVSHVTDLKDRVPERLEVRRLADGSSAVKVVA